MDNDLRSDRARAGQRGAWRRRTFVGTVAFSGAAMMFALLGPSAGAHGTGISVDCEKVTAEKPMDSVRIRREDGTQHTYDVSSTLTFTFPGPNEHGRVNGVYVTFDDQEQADLPVPD